MCSDPRVTKENSFGETWETSNPHDPTADLTIAQVRRRELRRREADERACGVSRWSAKVGASTRSFARL